MMRNLSISTKLMNVLIGLSIRNPHLNPVLFNSGYNLEYIEPHFLNNSGEVINPDLQFFSHNDCNLLFVECKLGNFEHQQTMRYKNLEKSDIIKANITTIDITNGNFEIMFCSDEANKNKLIKGDEINNYGFPIVSCNDNTITLERNQIKGEKLKLIFQKPINIPKMIPTEFYPYGPDDETEYIASCVFQSLLSLTGQGKEEISIEDILKDSHQLYDSIHPKGKDKLKQKVGKIMSDLDQNEFKDVLKILKNPIKYRISSKSYKRFRDLCLKLMETYRKNMEQKSLSEY